MRYVIHDYAGHPFQVHLSRHLAQRGHEVHHLYFRDHPGPKGWFEPRPSDPPTLKFTGITMGGPDTHAAGTGAMRVSRVVKEAAYGKATARIIKQLKPDIVLCGNTPPSSQVAIINLCKREGIPFIYWLQDIYSVAVSTLLAKKLGIVGKLIGHLYKRLDRHQFRASDAIIAISEDFPPLISSWAGKIPVTVIENWAAIDDIPVVGKDNPWARQHNLQSDFTFLYSGTLGRKHNPEFLLKLAHHSGFDESVVLVAQGFGVPMLKQAKANEGHRLDALKILPLQPAQDLANVLGTADVLLATIEAEAGTFAVPSKVLSYLCAGRPILLAAARNNLAARIVERANAGIVVDPADENGFIEAAHRLRSDTLMRNVMGVNARSYAERVFDLDRITDRFETVLNRTASRIPVPQLEVVTAK